MQNACNDINVSIDVGSTTSVLGTTNNIRGRSLGKGVYEKVVVTITYTNNENRSDGDFKVEFGDIGLTYSTVDYAPNLINFSYEGMNVSYNLVAEEGMTWEEWVESDYNTVGAFISCDSIYFETGFVAELQSSSSVIQDSYKYNWAPGGLAC